MFEAFKIIFGKHGRFLGELLSKRIGASKNMRIDETDQSPQFHQGILKRRSGKKKFRAFKNSGMYCLGDFIVFPVDISQAVGFINDYQVPWNRLQRFNFTAGKLVGTDNHGICLFERIPAFILLDLPKILRFKNCRIDIEFLR